MNSMSYYDRLVASAEHVARHPWHPGMERAINDCLEDVEGLVLAGRITEEQGASLRRILRGANSNAA